MRASCSVVQVRTFTPSTIKDQIIGVAFLRVLKGDHFGLDIIRIILMRNEIIEKIFGTNENKPHKLN